jgi:hypothetical protein
VAHKDYSGTPLYKKLGIKEGARVSLVGAPEGFESALAPLPPGVSITTSVRATRDIIVFFTSRRSMLERRFGALAGKLAPTGGLWIAYPKKASGVATDVTFEAVQATGLEAGLVDNKSIAVDEVWSGVRFVFRLEDRRTMS